MKDFDYQRAQTMTAAISAAASDDRRFLAGGTDLLPLMKAGIASPTTLIDIKRIAGASGIREAGQAIEFGPLTTLRAIESDALVRERLPVLARAASLAASPQIRNRATIGGNLLQRPRCWYFRNPNIDCWLKGGDYCPAREGENQLHALFAHDDCCAVHPSDLATALLALDATIRLESPAGTRDIPAGEFFAIPEPGRLTENIARQDEFVARISVPVPARGSRMWFEKAMERAAWTFAITSVAAVVRLDGDIVADARIVLGAVAPIPWRVPEAESVLRGRVFNEETIREGARAAVEGALPLSENAYKVQLAEGLVVRTLESLTR